MSTLLATLATLARLLLASVTHRVTMERITPDLDLARAETLCLRVSLDTPAVPTPAHPLACATCGNLLCDTCLDLRAEPALQCLRCLGSTCAGDCADRARLAWLEQELTRLGAPAPAREPEPSLEPAWSWCDSAPLATISIEGE